MPRYIVSYVLSRGMEQTVNAPSKGEAIKIVKTNPEEGLELDYEIENVEVLEVTKS